MAVGELNRMHQFRDKSAAQRELGEQGPRPSDLDRASTRASIVHDDLFLVTLAAGGTGVV